MRISFERDMSHNYMVPETGAEAVSEDYQIRMLTENHPKGLLDCVIKTVNCKSRYCYEITSRQSMAQLYEAEGLTQEEVVKILRCLYDTLQEVGRFLMDENRIVLEPEAIYLDVETKDARFCYLPIYDVTLVESFRIFADYLLRHLERNDPGAVLLGYEIYRQTMKENYGLKQVLRAAFKGKETGGGLGVRMPNTAQMDGGGVPGEMSTGTTPEDAGNIGMADPGTVGTVETTIEETADCAGTVGMTDTQDRKTKEKGKRDGKIRKKWMMGGFLLGVTAIAIMAAWFGIVSVTQAGGIVFLVMGLSGYALSLEKKQEEKQRKDQDDFVRKAEERAERRRRKRDGVPDADSRNMQNQNRGEACVLDHQIAPGQNCRDMTGMDLRDASGADSLEGQTVDDGAAFMGMTTVLRQGEEEYEPHLTLLGMNSRERKSVVLLNDSYLVGKLKSKVDIYIEDPAVSRIHAKIQKEGEDYYIQDMNSTNGTYFNGRRLEIQEKVKLQVGDELSFAETGYYVGKC